MPQFDNSASNARPILGAGAVVPGEGEPPANASARSLVKKFPPRKPLTAAQIQSSDDWQEALWKKWPTEEAWPVYLSVYESAAFMRIHPDLIRRALTPGRDGKAKLAYRKWGAIFRIKRTDLCACGRVDARG